LGPGQREQNRSREFPAASHLHNDGPCNRAKSLNPGSLTQALFDGIAIIDGIDLIASQAMLPTAHLIMQRQHRFAAIEKTFPIPAHVYYLFDFKGKPASIFAGAPPHLTEIASIHHYRFAA